MSLPNNQNAGAGAFSTPGVDPSPKTGPSQIITQNPVVIFNLDDVEPPSPLYISQAERLMLFGLSSDPGVVQLLLNGRLLRASDGQISPFNFTMNIGSSRVATRQAYDLAEGYLLGLQILGLGGTNRGRCFVQLSLIRGTGSLPGGVTLYQQLISDYISRGHDASWPAGEFNHSIDGPGFIRRVVGTTPAAGAEIVETVPTGARWILRGLRAQLTASATVANRLPGFVVDDGTTIFYQSEAGTVTAAAASSFYNLLPGGSTASTITTPVGTVIQSVPFPNPMELFAGWRIRTVTDNLQAGDQWSNVSYEVEEWIEF